MTDYYNFIFNQLYNLYAFMLGTWWLAVIVIIGIFVYIVNLIRSIQGKE